MGQVGIEPTPFSFFRRAQLPSCATVPSCGGRTCTYFTRVMSPLRNYSATPQWTSRDLNPNPLPCQGSVLPVGTTGPFVLYSGYMITTLPFWLPSFYSSTTMRHAAKTPRRCFVPADTFLPHRWQLFIGAYPSGHGGSCTRCLSLARGMLYWLSYMPVLTQTAQLTTKAVVHSRRRHALSALIGTCTRLTYSASRSVAIYGLSAIGLSGRAGTCTRSTSVTGWHATIRTPRPDGFRP